MAKLAPEIKKLQEKYKDDRQRLQAETMDMYKAHRGQSLGRLLTDAVADANLVCPVSHAHGGS